MSHTVAVGEFEGPLGLLLELVERNQMPVTQISVADITVQYLERLQALEPRDPEELSEFLQLGARLLYIKSLALLPADPATDQAEELRQLNLELEEYRQFQQAARWLAGQAAQPTWERPVAERLPAAELPWPQLELPELTAAFARALGRLQPTPTPGVVRQAVRLETVMQQLRERLAGGGFELNELLAACQDRPSLVVTFLALLELVRAGAARAQQADQFAPIAVEAARG